MKKTILISVIIMLMLSSAVLAVSYYPLTTSTKQIQTKIAPSIKTTPLCIEGTTRCYDNNFQKCKNGNWITLDKCSSVEKCDSKEGCVKKELEKSAEKLMQGCRHGETRCIDNGRTYQVCINALWRISDTCESYEVCREGRGCVEVPSRGEIKGQEPRQLAICEEGKTKCEYNLFKKCRNNKWVISDNCNRKGVECNDVRGCIPISPRAPPEPEEEQKPLDQVKPRFRCVEGSTTCSGNNFMFCRNGQWEIKGFCKDDERCDNERGCVPCVPEGKSQLFNKGDCCPGLAPEGFLQTCKKPKSREIIPPGLPQCRHGQTTCRDNIFLECVKGSWQKKDKCIPKKEFCHNEKGCLPLFGPIPDFFGQDPDQQGNGDGPQGNGDQFGDDDQWPGDDCCDEMEECCNEMQECCGELRERVDRLEVLVKRLLSDRCAGPGHKPDVYTGRCCPGLVILNGICSVPKAAEEKQCAKEGLRADMYGGCCEGLIRQGGICVTPEKPLCAGPGLMASGFDEGCCPGLVRNTKGVCTLPVAPEAQCARQGLRADMYGGRCCEGLVEVQGICKRK